MHLVLVESGAKAKTIQTYLNGFNMGSYEVIASLGHVLDLPLKTMGIDVETWTPEYKINEGRSVLVRKITKAAKTAERIYLAADPDREGEAIAANLKTLLMDAGIPEERMVRVAFHEITKEALREAITHPRPLDLNLIHAQETRRMLDRVVGYEASPLLWRRFTTGKLSAGRVQSATLKMVVERHRQYTQHTYEPYWSLYGRFQLDGWEDALEAKASDEWDAPDILQELAWLPKASWSVSLKQTEGTRRPPAPLTTSSLQQEAAKKHGFPIEMTMKIAQELYEMGAITYMRTDSTTLSAAAKANIAAWITEHYGKQWNQPRHYKTTVANAQEAHEAIRPTDFTEANEAKLKTDSQKKLYQLIWRRTIASQMKDATVVGLDYKVVGVGKNEEKRVVFKGRQEVITFLGFMAVLQPDAVIDPVRLETLEKLLALNGAPIQPVKLTFKGDVKRPEPLYQEASLVKLLEKKGIGRPSTYAPTLKKLFSKGYVMKGGAGTGGSSRDISVIHYCLSFQPESLTQEESKISVGNIDAKALVPTALGIRIIDYLGESLETILDPDFTADMETQLDAISRGEQKKNDVLNGFYKDFHKNIVAALGVQSETAKTTTKKKPPKLETGIVLTRYGPAYYDASTKTWVSVSPYMEWRKKTLEELTEDDLGFLRKLPLTVEGTTLEIHMGRYGLYVKDTGTGTGTGKNYSLNKDIWDDVFHGNIDAAVIQANIVAPAAKSRAWRGSKKP
jgi:DNA topoisomerase-1